MVIWQLTRGSDITCNFHTQTFACISIAHYTVSELHGTLPHYYTYGRYEWPQIGGAIHDHVYFLGCPEANSMSHTLLLIVLVIRYVLSMGFV